MRADPPPTDLCRCVEQRLLALSPRAFELFAGDLLTFLGLQRVVVTRYAGDGGIDAHGELVGEAGLIRVPAGVQVKRHRSNVQRADIDRFLGALGGSFPHGIFITTAGFAPQARVKARSSPSLLVDTIGGGELVALICRHQLGLRPDETIDEDYFAAFELQATPARALRDAPEPYGAAAASPPVDPADDLISLRALGYALRIDPATLRVLIERGRLSPDRSPRLGLNEGFFFRHDRVEPIRAQLGATPLPASGAEWCRQFLDFALSRRLSKSYKPAMLKALLRVVDPAGAAPLDALAAEFLAFYQERQRHGLPVEFAAPLLQDPSRTPLAAVAQLLLRHPLERFLIQGFLQYDRAARLVRFHPALWAELRASELLELAARAEQQLAYYSRRP